MSHRIDAKSIAGKVPRVAEQCDVAVVGGGPAGCAAAIEAAAHGLRVLLVDEHPLDPALIGMDVPFLFGQRADASVQEPSRLLEQVLETNAALAQAFDAGVEVRVGGSAWGAFINGPAVRWLPKPLLGLADRERSWLAGFRRLIVAAGRRDLALAFPGWDRPGVIGLAGLHTLQARYRAFSGRRLVMVGSGTDALLGAAAAIDAGIEVAAIVEIADAAEGPPDLAAALPILTSATIVGTEASTDGIAAVHVGTLAGGERRTIACDTLCLGFGVAPNVELLDVLGCALAFRPELGGHVPVTTHGCRTTLPEVLVAGDCAGVTPAKSLNTALAAAEGRLAGWHAAASLRTARTAAPAAPAVGVGGWALHRWAEMLRRSAPADLVVCQCEEVTLGDLLGLRPPRYLESDDTRGMAALLGDGPLSQDQVKRLTRAGMGPCQGRRCRDQVSAWLAAATGAAVTDFALPTYRPPLRPLPLATLRDAEEAATMREHWEAWFGIESQWVPPWAIAEPARGQR